MATKVKPPLLPLFFSVTLFLFSASLPLRLLNQPDIEGKEQHAGDGGGSGGDGGMGGEDLEEKYKECKELCDKQPHGSATGSATACTGSVGGMRDKKIVIHTSMVWHKGLV